MDKEQSYFRQKDSSLKKSTPLQHTKLISMNRNAEEIFIVVQQGMDQIL